MGFICFKSLWFWRRGGGGVENGGVGLDQEMEAEKYEEIILITKCKVTFDLFALYAKHSFTSGYDVMSMHKYFN